MTWFLACRKSRWMPRVSQGITDGSSLKTGCSWLATGGCCGRRRVWESCLGIVELSLGIELYVRRDTVVDMRHVCINPIILASRLDNCWAASQGGGHSSRWLLASAPHNGPVGLGREVLKAEAKRVKQILVKSSQGLGVDPVRLVELRSRRFQDASHGGV